MAFSSSSSSIPCYHLDDPPTITTNSWTPLPPPPPPSHHHHQHHHHQSNQQLPGRSGENVPGTEFTPPLLPPSGQGGGGSGSVRPHSTAERARLAKIPQPEAGLNCPRCDSTNTKFCYFNNYSLSQPRHFCKTCRRYWTRGGALRNVPVGGGCRRNKRAKGGRGRSKSPVTERAGAATPGLSNTTATGTTAGDILGHLATQLTQLPLFPPLCNLNEYAPSDVGAGIGLDFQVGSGDHSQWRMRQMPQIPSFFANTLEGQGIGQLLSNNKTLYSSPNVMADPTTTVKSEGLRNIRDLNQSSTNFASVNEQYATWVGNANWSDLSGGFSSAPTGHLS